MKTIIVEGGAMRGIFPAGVLKAFADRNFDDFQLYIGVSFNGPRLVVGQIG
jgi:predicted patatin/cPLA2 family phospholipase